MNGAPDVFLVPSQFATIQEAVDAVVRPATILVAPGVYEGSVVVEDREYVVVQSTRLTRRAVVLTGGDPRGVVVGRRSTLHLSGLEVRSDGGSRGIELDGCTFSTQDCVVAGNRTGGRSASRGPGAGLLCRDSSVHLQKTTVAGNTVDGRSGGPDESRGAGVVLEGCRVHLAGCTFQTNAVLASGPAAGGGLWMVRSGGRMWRCRVTDNVLLAPHGEGAGMFVAASTGLEVGGCVVTGNGCAEGSGGGLYLEGDGAGVRVHPDTFVKQNAPDDVRSGGSRYLAPPAP